MSERILIVRLSALGDTALTLPLLQVLRERLPDAFIGWVVEEKAASLLRGLPGIDRLHIWKQHEKSLRGAWRFSRELKAVGYTYALDAQGLTKSALLPLLAGIPRRIGFRRAPLEAREFAPFFNNKLISPPAELTHITLRTQYLAQGLGLQPPYVDPAEGGCLPVQAAGCMLDWWRDKIGSSRAIVFGVGTSWMTKIWPVEHMAHAVRAAQTRGWKTVVTWGPDEEKKLPEWQKFFGDGVIWSPRTTSVGELAALLNCAQAYAGPDSAPLHIAWLLGKPTFSWFGPSDAARGAPVGKHQRHIIAYPPTRQRKGEMLWSLEPTTVLAEFLPWLEALAV